MTAGMYIIGGGEGIQREGVEMGVKKRKGGKGGKRKRKGEEKKGEGK